MVSVPDIWGIKALADKRRLFWISLLFWSTDEIFGLVLYKVPPEIAEIASRNIFGVLIGHCYQVLIYSSCFSKEGQCAHACQSSMRDSIASA